MSAMPAMYEWTVASMTGSPSVWSSADTSSGSASAGRCTYTMSPRASRALARTVPSRCEFQRGPKVRRTGIRIAGRGGRFGGLDQQRRLPLGALGGPGRPLDQLGGHGRRPAGQRRRPASASAVATASSRPSTVAAR